MAVGWYLLPSGDPFYGTIPDDADEISEPGGFALNRQHVTRPAAWGRRWAQALSEAGSRLVALDIWGDSISCDGFGSSDPRTLSVPGLIEAELQAKYGNGGTGFLNHSYAVATGTWTDETPLGFGGTGARATAAASLTWSDLRGTTIRLWHRNAGVTGSFRYQVDGGGFTTVNPPTGFGTEPGTVEITGLSDTTHTLRVEWVSGAVVIHGVQARRSAGIIVNRLGRSGRAASHFSPGFLQKLTIGTTLDSGTITSSPGAFTAAMVNRYLSGANLRENTQITAVASGTSATISPAAAAAGTVTVDVQINPSINSAIPGRTLNPFLATGLGRADAVLLMLGVNDPATVDYSAATWRDGASRILKPYYDGDAFAYSPDLIVAVEHQGNWFDLDGQWPEMVSQHAALAEAMGGALVDVWGMGRRSFKFWSDPPESQFADTVHLNDKGCATAARAILSNLLLAA